MIWRQISYLSEIRLLALFRSWLGTPYIAGQRVRGGGCDCVQFVAMMLDEMARRPPSQIPRLAADSAIHRSVSALPTIRALVRCNGGKLIRDGVIEPGDVLVTRASTDRSPRRPGHVMLAGVRPFSVWHSYPRVGVTETSTSACKEILQVWRPKDKSSWD